jgi:hypothetical protein
MFVIVRRGSNNTPSISIDRVIRTVTTSVIGNIIIVLVVVIVRSIPPSKATCGLHLGG